MELPYLCEDTSRTKNLITLEEDEEGKRTAEDCGSYWMVVNWEIEEIDGQKYWFNRSGASIGKAEVEKLHALSANYSSAPQWGVTPPA